MASPDPSSARSLARALRMLDPRLVGDALRPSLEDDRGWLAANLVGRGEIMRTRTAADVAANVVAIDADALAGLFAIARDEIELRRGVPAIRNPARWHEIIAELEPDVIVAAALISSDFGLRTVELVALLSWPSVPSRHDFSISSVLLQPLAESHVHLGGSLPASFYWVATMCEFALADRLPRLFPPPPGDYDWIAAVRDALNYRKRLASAALGLDIDTMPRWATSRTWGPDQPLEPFADPLLLALLPDGQERRRYNPVLGERWLLLRALRMAHDFHDQFALRKCLIDYLRIRNSFIHCMRHHDRTPGLDSFVQTFCRADILYEPGRGRARTRRRRRLLHQALKLERFRAYHALRFQFSDPTDAPWNRDHGLGIEKARPPSIWRPPRDIVFRVSPGRWDLRLIAARLRGVRDFVEFERDAPDVRVGFIYHVIRQPDARAFRSMADFQLRGLHAMVCGTPELRRFVVGIDVAGDELLIPPRTIGKIFREIRDRVAKQPPSPGHDPIVMQRTCHAGEDFRDLLTGLRHIHETLELLDLQPGERIGHGTALALPPRLWYAGRSSVHPLRGEHLLDLVWLVAIAEDLHPRHRLDTDIELRHHAEALLERRFPDVALTRARDLARSAFRLDAHGRPRLDPNLDEFDLAAHLGVVDVSTPLEVDVDPSYMKMVAKARRRVLVRAIEREIVVEVCPTSNLLIGGFGRYANLPYLHLHRAPLPAAPEGCEAEAGWEDEFDPRIPISINSDDPGTFHTNIEAEYRLLGRGLIDAGYRHHDVVAWLQQAREVGLNSSFLPRWNPVTRGELLNYLEAMMGRDPGRSSRSVDL